MCPTAPESVDGFRPPPARAVVPKPSPARSANQRSAGSPRAGARPRRQAAHEPPGGRPFRPRHDGARGGLCVTCVTCAHVSHAPGDHVTPTDTVDLPAGHVSHGPVGPGVGRRAHLSEPRYEIFASPEPCRSGGCRQAVPSSRRAGKLHAEPCIRQGGSSSSPLASRLQGRRLGIQTAWRRGLIGLPYSDATEHNWLEVPGGGGAILCASVVALAHEPRLVGILWACRSCNGAESTVDIADDGRHTHSESPTRPRLTGRQA
eukprot:scaffold1216_cov357-Prasinococcus_capsulatus_cf.AAC.1